MADIMLFHRLHERQNRRERVFRDRTNQLNYMSDPELISRYRLPRQAIEDLIDLIKVDIEPQTFRSHALDATTKTLLTLRYLAKGDFFSETGDIHGVSRSSVSRAVECVVEAINRNLTNIRFPTDDGEIRQMKRSFYRIAGIPNVIGAVDGTFVPIVAPVIDEPAYICRKGYHALNVQAIVGPDMRFTDIVARWPGSQHDATIFQNSSIREHLEGLENCWLLGDSGYPLRRYLMTPKLNSRTEAEVSYNTNHSRTRILVEKAFGVLKSRFRCLHKTGGCLPFSPGKSCQVIGACMRLHNRCMELGLPLPDIEDVADEHDDAVISIRENATAQILRKNLINNFQ